MAWIPLFINYCSIFMLFENILLDGKLQGFGIVQFKEVDDASKAMAEMNAKPILSMFYLHMQVAQ